MDIRKERLLYQLSGEGMQYVWQHEDMTLFAKGDSVVQEKVQFAYPYFVSTFLTLCTSAQGQIFVSATIYFNELPIYALIATRKNLDPVHVPTLPFLSHAKPLHPKNVNGNLRSTQVSGRCGELWATRGDQKLWLWWSGSCLHGIPFAASLS